MQRKVENIENSIREIERLKRIISQKKVRDVNTQDERDMIKAVAFSWIKTYQPNFDSLKLGININLVSDLYCKLLEFSDNRIKRLAYIDLIKKIRFELIRLRTEVIKLYSTGEILKSGPVSMPDFSTLISDSRMVIIIKKRWNEIENCLQNDAPLAATVMMGGLLESVLMTKTNSLPDKAIVFRQKSTPIDLKTKKARPLNEWMLKDFIDVLAEIKIISKPSAEFSRIVRDCRNYIHPEKELRIGEAIQTGDAKLFWVITSNLIEQILLS